MRTVFFGRVVSFPGTFQPSVKPTPNPYNPQANTCIATRLAQGQYRLTFGNAMPLSEYAYTLQVEDGSLFFVTIHYILTGPVVDVFTEDNFGAAIDCDWWIKIQEIGNQSLS